MFNVSSLLLDDALKPATPLTNGAISGVAGFSASLMLRCGGVFSNSVITNFLLIRVVK